MSDFRVAECYPCLQGEGYSVGRPSILLRFQGCNLRCRWCDTPHALSRDRDEGQLLSTDALVAKVSSLSESSTPSLRHLILTGGEPTLQPLHRLLAALNANGKVWSAEVESNGTRIPHLSFPDFSAHNYHDFQWNISPKLGSSGLTPHLPALTHWSALARAGGRVFFKFVVQRSSAEKDLSEILTVIEGFRLPRERVWLMPEGTSRESQIETQWLLELALRHNLRFSPRLHIILFGNQRGV